MEMIIPNRCDKSSSSYEFKKDKGQTKKSSKPSKASTKDTMTTSIEKLVRILGKSRSEEKKGSSSRDEGRKRPTLKELSEKKYPFPDLDLSGMLDDLLENGIIKLPAPKRPEEDERTTDPKCCCYHRVISHPLEKCLQRIMQLARDRRIILDLDDSVRANHISAEVEHTLPSWQQSPVRSYE